MGVGSLASQHAKETESLQHGSDGLLVSPKGETVSAVKVSAEKQRRKAIEKSVLDDIMGDPDDFGELGDSDAESDGGRWEDTLEEPEQDAYVPHELEVQGVESKLLVNKDDAKLALDPQGEAQLQGSQCGSKEQSSLGRDHHSLGVDNSSAQNYTGICVPQKRKAGMTRYFIIKSLNRHNIEKSIERGIWATQAMNESILNEAFESADKVLLIFSINMSGHFQGYAQMVSPIGRRRARVWNEANWGGTFDVEWIRLYDLPFQKTVHLKNPLNMFKPVKISRDCQELTQEIGEALCALIDEGADAEFRPRRRFEHGDTSLAKQLCMPSNTGGMFRPIVGPTSMTSLMYPGNFASPITHEPYNLHMPIIRSTVSSPSASRGFNKQSRNSRSRSPRTEKGPCGERGRSNDQYDGRERASSTREKDSSRSSSDAPLEEDLLNMTYEEYLQRHGNRGDYTQWRQGAGTATSSDAYGGRWMMNNDNTEMSCPDEQYSNYLANWYGNQQGLIMQNGCYLGAQAVAGSYPGGQPL